MSNQFKKTKIASYICLALASSAALAEEESKNNDDIEVIEVTGIRSSLAGEIAAKKSSDAISDSIIAEEIGKSSDENIAEAISRIAGISLDANGESITVRGIQASLNDIKLNGISMTSSSDNQAVDLSLFSADMLSRIDVVKSPSANQEEGSLGASINLQTRSPLSAKKSTHIVSAEARYNDLSEEATPRFSYSFIENFSDNLGFSGSFFHDKVIERKEEFSSQSAQVKTYYSEPSTNNAKKKGKVEAQLFDFVTGDPIIATVDDPLYAMSNEAALNRISIDEKVKKGGTFTLQYQPTENTDIRLDTTFSRQEIEHKQSQIKMNNFDKGNSRKEVYVLQSDGEQSNTVFRSKTDTVGGLIQPAEYDSTVDNLIVGLNIEQFIGDYWTINGRVGYSSTQQEYDNSTKVNWTKVDNTQLGDSDTWCNVDYVNAPQDDFIPEMNFCSTFDGNDADTLKLTQFRTNVRDVDDVKTSAYFDVERSFDDSFISSIEFGVKYTKRDKSVQAEEINLKKEHFENTDIILASDIDDNNITEDRFLDGIAPAGSPQSWVYPDIEQTTALLFPSGLDRSNFESDLSKTSKLSEETYGAYAQVNYELFDDAVRGNFGIRYAKTEMSGDSYSSIEFKSGIPYVESFLALPENGGDPNQTKYSFPNVEENDYDNWLPSATLIWSITDDLLFRTAAARVLARPKIDDSRPSYAVRAASDENTPTGKGGNSQLDPFLADQYDMALEWYFADSALLSATVFYKDFVSFTYKTKTDRTFENEDYPLFGHPGAPNCLVDQSLTTAEDPLNPCAKVDYQTVVNGGSADIKGLELSYQQNYDFLPGMLKYLGTSINYTYADSNAIVDPENLSSPYNNLPFINTSKHSANIRAYWENDWSSYRLAYSYRGRSLQTVVSKTSSLVAEAKGTLDFSANWTINKNLKVTAAVTNLTNSYDKVINALTDASGYAADSGIYREMSNDLDSISDQRVNKISSKGRGYRLFLRYSF